MVRGVVPLAGSVVLCVFVRQAEFKFHYQDKTGNVWGEPFNKMPGKYSFVEIDYSVGDDAVTNAIAGAGA